MILTRHQQRRSKELSVVAMRSCLKIVIIVSLMIFTGRCEEDSSSKDDVVNETSSTEEEKPKVSLKKKKRTTMRNEKQTLVHSIHR